MPSNKIPALWPLYENCGKNYFSNIPLNNRIANPLQPLQHPTPVRNIVPLKGCVLLEEILLLITPCYRYKSLSNFLDNNSHNVTVNSILNHRQLLPCYFNVYMSALRNSCTCVLLFIPRVLRYDKDNCNKIRSRIP